MERTAALLAELRGGTPDEGDVERLRDAAMDLLATVVRHRQLGADLLWEAYEVDVSAGD